MGKTDRKSILSVIVVCFNEQKRIRKTLDSILQQSYKNMECIIVDGASQDGTLEIIEEYRQTFSLSGIEYRVISERDKGIYDAMNKGVKNADGKWVYFLNAGDIFHRKDAVENVMAEIRYEDEIVIGKVIFFDGYLGRTIEQAPLEELRKDMIFCHQAILTKRNLLEDHCFDIGYRYCADYEWLLSMYLEGKRIHCVNTVVADYDGNGVSAKHAEESRKEMRQIQEKYGLAGNRKEISQINRKYRLYKKIGTYKILSLCFYYLYGKRKNYYYNRNQK